MTNYTPSPRWKTTCGILFTFLFVLTTTLLAAEADVDSGVEKETMFSLLKKGGHIMWPLAAASIIMLALGLERFISLRREKVLPNGFLEGLGQAWDMDPTGQAAEQFCDQSQGAAGHVFKAGIQWRDAGYQAVGKAIEDAGVREADKMKRSLRGLSIIAAVSPLLGLLGTVYGMIDAFQTTSASGGFDHQRKADIASRGYESFVAQIFAFVTRHTGHVSIKHLALGCSLITH